MRRHLFPVILSAIVLGACGRPPVRFGSPPEPSPSTTCPSGIQGARLRMEETDDAVVLSFKAYGDVHEVRRRAHDAAAMYGPGAHRGVGHEGHHGIGQRHGLALDRLGVAVLARAENTPEGARIVVRPIDPADLSKVKDALADREGRARGGGC